MHAILQIIFLLVFRYPKISLPAILFFTAGYWLEVFTVSDFVALAVSIFILLFLSGLYITVHEFLTKKDMTKLANKIFQITALTFLAISTLTISIYMRNMPTKKERARIQANIEKIEDDQFVQNYLPNYSLSQIIDKVKFTEEGLRLFYLTDPELIYSKKAIADICQNSQANHGSNLLGCFKTNSNKIYLLDTKTKSAQVIVATTAAHELLHAVYSKMDFYEKSQINNLLEQMIRGNSKKILADRLKAYGDMAIDHKLNEIYAIIGSEHFEIPAELEINYNRYFDRSYLLKISSHTKKQTETYIKNVDYFDKKINLDKENIKTKKLKLKSLISDLHYIKKDMSDYKNVADYNNYNMLTAEYNSKINSINNSQEELSEMIKEYNSQISIRNKEAYNANRIQNAFSK